MKMIKINFSCSFICQYPCENGVCRSLIGTNTVAVPSRPWICPNCGLSNVSRIKYCRQCYRMAPSTYRDYCTKNRSFKVPKWVRWLNFENCAGEYYWFFSNCKLTKPYDQYQLVDDNQLIVYLDTPDFVSNKFKITVSSKPYTSKNRPEVFTFTLTDANNSEYLQILATSRQMPKSHKEVNLHLFDFKRNDMKVIQGSTKYIVTWKLVCHDSQPMSDVFKAKSTKDLKRASKPKEESEIMKRQWARLTNAPLITYDIESTTVINPKSKEEFLVPYSIAIYSEELKIEKFFINKSAIWCDYRRSYHPFSLDPIYEQRLPYTTCMSFPYYANTQDTPLITCRCEGKAAGLKEGMLYLANTVIDLAISGHTDVLLCGYNNYNFDDILIEDMFENAMYNVAIERLKDVKFKFSYQTRFGKKSSAIWTLTFNRNDFCIMQDLIDPTNDMNSIYKGQTYGSLTQNQKEYLLLLHGLDIDDDEDKLDAIYTGVVNVYIVDSVKYVPDVTLAKACVDYEIASAKQGVDSVKLSKFFTQLGEIVYSYELKPGEKFVDKFLTEDCDMGEQRLMQKDFVKQRKFVDLYGLIKKYNIYDAKATYELFTKIKKSLEQLVSDTCPSYKKHPLTFMSISHISMYVFRTMTNYEKPIFETSTLTAIDKTLFAGRTDFTILGEYSSPGNLEYWDVTSEYPLAMTANYPIGEWHKVDHNFIQTLKQQIAHITCKRAEQFAKGLKVDDDLSYFNQMDKMFFIYADIHPPPEEYCCIWSPIAKRFNNSMEEATDADQTTRLAFTFDPEEGRYLNSVQVKTLLLAGWIVIPCEDQEGAIYWDNSTPLFLNFVDKIGSLKTQAREENKSYAKILKLVLNSLAGKMGQKTTHYVSSYRHHFNVKAPPPFPGETDWYEKNGTIYYQNEPEEEVAATNDTHYLASFIWAYANWIMFSNIQRLHCDAINAKKKHSDKTGIVLYCDTDSLVIDRSRATPVNFIESEEIGRWNNDKHDFDSTWKCKYKDFDSIIVFAKKSYLIIKKGVNICRKLKGIRGQDAEKININLARELVDKFMKNETAKFTTEIIRLDKSRIGAHPISSRVITTIKTCKSLTFTKFYDEIKSTNPLDKDQQCIFCRSKWPQEDNQQ